MAACRRRRPIAAALALLCALAAGAASIAAAQVNIERITGTGDAGPTGLPQSQVLAPAEGPTREVAFVSRLTGAFRRATGGVAQEVGSGSTVPGGVVAGVGAVALDDAGCAVVVTTLVGGDEAIYRRCPDGIERVAGLGDATSDGGVVERLDFGGVAAAGPYVAFLARLDDGVDAVLRTDGIELVEIARPGSPSPAGGTLTTLRLAGILPAGQVGLRASVSGGRDGLFRGAGGALVKALVEGEASLVGRVDGIEQATLSRGGIWAFLGELEDGRAGVFRFDGSLSLPLVEAISLTGAPVPMRPGTTVRDFPTSLVPSLNASGDVAFRAVLGGTGSGAALFATRGGAVAELLFSTRDSTSLGLLSRLSDPRLADDGSVLFSATPVRGGTGVFVHRGTQVSALALFGTPTDLGRPDLPFRFVDGRVRATAENGILLGEHDTLVRVGQGGALESVTAVGAPSPVGGRFAEIGWPEIDSRGRIYLRAGVADAQQGEGIFVVTDRGVVDRVVTNERLRGGRLRDVVEQPAELGGDLASARRLIAFAALVGDGGGTGSLYLMKGRRIRRLERTGRSRRGLDGEIVALHGRPALVRRRRYAFLAELRDGTTRSAIVVRRGRRRRTAAREGPSTDTRLPGRFRAFTIPDATAHAVVFRVTTDQGGAQGVFVDDWRRTRVAVVTGDADREGRILRSFERPVLVGTEVVVAATIEDAGRLADGIVRFSAPLADDVVPEAETVLRAGDVLPGGALLHDVLSMRGTARGALLARVATRAGAARQLVVRLNLDPPQPSQ